MHDVRVAELTPRLRRRIGRDFQADSAEMVISYLEALADSAFDVRAASESKPQSSLHLADNGIVSSRCGSCLGWTGATSLWRGVSVKTIGA